MRKDRQISSEAFARITRMALTSPYVSDRGRRSILNTLAGVNRKGSSTDRARSALTYLKMWKEGKMHDVEDVMP